jgi:hypothetical protein
MWFKLTTALCFRTVNHSMLSFELDYLKTPIKFGKLVDLNDILVSYQNNAIVNITKVKFLRIVI